MAPPDPAPWSDRLAATLRRYDEPLLRKVAGRLLRPRNLWPVEDLISRSLEVFDNPVVLDRRLAELAPASRQLLALIGHSRQPEWVLGNLVELAMALGCEDGLAPVLDLLEAGLASPVLDLSPAPPSGRRLAGFEHWLGTVSGPGLVVFSPPQVFGRAVGTDLGLPDLSAEGPEGGGLAVTTGVLEADGLEWLFRLGVLWQQVAAAPLRRTQQGGL